MIYGIRCATCDTYQSNGPDSCVRCGERLRARPVVNRRHFFAAAGALVASPFLPEIVPAPSSRILPRMSFTVQLLGSLEAVPEQLIARMIRKSIEDWKARGCLNPWLDDLVIVGTVSV